MVYNWIEVSCSLRITTQKTRVRSPGAVSVLGQRHRRWASIESALGRRLVFAGYQPILRYYRHSELMIML